MVKNKRGKGKEREEIYKKTRNNKEKEVKERKKVKK